MEDAKPGYAPDPSRVSEYVNGPRKEHPVDIVMIDPVGTDGPEQYGMGAECVTVPQNIRATIQGIDIPLCKRPVKVVFDTEDAIVAYLPVFVRSLTSVRAERVVSYPGQPDIPVVIHGKAEQ